MTLLELIKATGQLPNRAVTANGVVVEVDVTRQKLGYIARLWEVKGLGIKERVLQYGTGHTPESARETLKKKLLK